MGRRADRRLAGDPSNLGTWDRPTEDPREGCPGGWRRTWLAAGLQWYYRRRTRDGDRVANPALDDTADWLVRAAIRYIEDEEERAFAHREAVWHTIRTDREAMTGDG